jgi:glycosyltransferase involved in cell wall biosynthesis
VRILYFSRDYTPHDYRFLDTLSKSEHQTYYLRLENDRRVQERRPLPSAIEEISWQGGRRKMHLTDGPSLVFSLRHVFGEVNPDLVQAGPVQQGAFLTALAGYKPLVTMSWGSDLLVNAARGVGRWAAKYTLARSNVLICDCQTVSNAAQQLGMPPERIVAFPWGIDIRHFTPGGDRGLRARLGWEDNFVLLSTRSWEPIYGIEILVAGFIQAAQANPNLRLLMLGGGSLQPRIEAMLDKPGMLEFVHFAGQVDYPDLPAHYHAADLYLSASRSDGTSISLLEAFACGLPVVVSDIPGNREWVESGVNGWLFPDGDKVGLANFIIAACQTDLERNEYGKANRLVAERRADWKRNFKSLLMAYELAAATRRMVDG